MNLNKVKTFLNQARLILWCLLLKCKLFEAQRDSTSQTDGATCIWFTVAMQIQTRAFACALRALKLRYNCFLVPFGNENFSWAGVWNAIQNQLKHTCSVACMGASSDRCAHIFNVGPGNIACQKMACRQTSPMQVSLKVAAGQAVRPPAS